MKFVNKTLSMLLLLPTLALAELPELMCDDKCEQKFPPCTCVAGSKDYQKHYEESVRKYQEKNKENTNINNNLDKSLGAIKNPTYLN